MRRCAEEDIPASAAGLLQGIARILCGDLEGGDASLEDAVSACEEAGAHENLAAALCERSLVAMARNQWDRAGALAGQAGTVLREAGIEDIYVTPLVCAVQARAAWHGGDVLAARGELVTAQRLRHLLTYGADRMIVFGPVHPGAHTRTALVSGVILMLCPRCHLSVETPGGRETSLSAAH